MHIEPRTRSAPLPLVGRGWGWGSELEDAFRATTATPTPPAFAALRRATLPTRGRVRPSSPLVLIAFHQTCSNRRIPAAQRSPLRLVEAGKADIDGADGIDLEGDDILARLDRERRHHRPGDDDFSAAQPLAEGREHIGDVAHDADPLPGIGLRIAGARELASTPNDAASEAVRGAAGARRSAATQHHVALIDVAAENALRILRRRGEIDDLDRRRDAGDRGPGGLMVGAGGNVAADVHGDFRLGHGLDPAGKRYASSRLNARIARQKSHQRSGDVEALEHRRRGEAHLPAQRRVAGVKTLAPQLELRPHAAYDARILPEIHDQPSVALRSYPIGAKLRTCPGRSAARSDALQTRDRRGL